MSRVWLAGKAPWLVWFDSVAWFLLVCSLTRKSFLSVGVGLGRPFNYPRANRPSFLAVLMWESQSTRGWMVGFMLGPRPLSCHTSVGDIEI